MKVLYLRYMKTVLYLFISICVLGDQFAFTKINNDRNLSPLTKFDHLQGREFKGVIQIELDLRRFLKYFGITDLQELTRLDDSIFATVNENTVFLEDYVNGKIDINKAARKITVQGRSVTAIKGGYIIPATANQIKYYCLISHPEETGSFHVTVAPERLLGSMLRRTKAPLKFTHDILNNKDIAIMEDYLEHELEQNGYDAIDPWIARRMKKGEFAVSNIYAYHDIYESRKGKKIYETHALLEILENIDVFLEKLGLNRERRFSLTASIFNRPLVFIPYGEISDLPSKTIDGQRIKVYGHSSENATYIFVKKELFDAIDTYDKKVLAEEEDPGPVWQSKAFSDLTERTLIHELGARCGLETGVVDGRTRNILDDYYEKYREHPQALMEIKSSDQETIAGIKHQDLNMLESRKDYAAGTTEEIGVSAAAVGKEIDLTSIEIYMPSVLFPRGMVREYRKVLGEALQIFDSPENLAEQIAASKKGRADKKRIVMLLNKDIRTGDDLQVQITEFGQIPDINSTLENVRFVNFEPIDLDLAKDDALDRYIMNSLTLLLAARAITPQNAKDKSSHQYRWLSYLLGNHLEGNDDDITKFINSIVNDRITAMDRLKKLAQAILKEVPIEAQEELERPMRIFWSA